jgi:two-component system OmpR family sensor kinase
MDGFKGKIASSLQFRLSSWLALVIICVAVAAGIFSFAAALTEANELQDDQLRQVAALLNDHRLSAAPPMVSRHAADSDPEFRVIVQALPPGGASPAPPVAGMLRLPANLSDGIQTVVVHDVSWRLLVRSLDAGGRVAVGQQTAVRDEIARDSAVRTLMPFLILIPILLVLVGYLIRQIFKPLRRLASEIDHRSEQDVQEIRDTGLPTEIKPFVVAINRLLTRVAQSVAAQRRFVADAAHELRSPLTALSLQAESLAGAAMSEEARVRLKKLGAGLQRTRLLLDQLLAMARAQQPAAPVATVIAVQDAFRSVLEDLLPLAEARHIDVGVVGENGATLTIAEVDLKTLLKNLVENAIRHSPRGGRVDLSVETIPGHVIVRVDDTGPGIAAHEREKVFSPFYRVLGNDELGSGLGLSIVKAIADRVGASIDLGASAPSQTAPGLRVTVTFPV